MELTKRGVVWLGQTCNLRCYFCYFRDKIKDNFHPEHNFMNIEKAKKIMNILRFEYGNNAVDIQGGEPTIYPKIYELVKYCNKIGLKPTLITNGIVLEDEEKVKKFKEAGINDFLFSLHSLGEDYDRIVGVKGAHIKQKKALDNLKKYNIPIRFNCTLTKEAVKNLLDISKIAINYNVKIVNFITFNPFGNQEERNIKDVPKYSEIKKNLQKAIDLLEAYDIEVNVRYFPLCMLDEKYRKNMYNFQQLSYDKHEWDYYSWSWSSRFNQKTASNNIDKPLPIPVVGIKKYNGIDLSNMIKIENGRYDYNLPIEEYLFKLYTSKVPAKLLYKYYAKFKTQYKNYYIKNEECKNCSLYDICDGFHSDYVKAFGMQEAQAVIDKCCHIDPTYYIQKQKKI